jgi:cytidylate kinase
MEAKMINIDDVVLDEYEQDIEDHAEQSVSASEEEKVKFWAAVQPHVTIALDALCAARLTTIAAKEHKTIAEVAAALLHRDLECA